MCLSIPRRPALGMAVTWRAVVLAALGLVPVALLPATATVLLWGLLVVLACAVDLALAASPREVAISTDGNRHPRSVIHGTAMHASLNFRHRITEHTTSALEQTLHARSGYIFGY